MQVGPYTVLEHTETVSPLRFVVFWQKDGRQVRAEHLGKKGGFRTWDAAVKAASDSAKYGTTNV